MNIPITTNISCNNKYEYKWHQLQELEIANLSPYSSFNIEIIPFNNNKPYLSHTTTQSTKAGGEYRI